VQIENGVLTIAGERPREQRPVQATVPVDERFAGRCRRVVNLPDGIAAHHAEVALPKDRRVFTLPKELDTAQISAELHHGVLS
jgi:HSP20 family molecular chaperone IbpA